MAVNIQQITDYLLQYKTLSLEKIGTISIHNPVTSAEDGVQSSSTVFVFDKRAETSEGLYAYIAELQQKKLSIVHSDVDSFIEESRQLMNIGSRPIHFQGIGYIFSDKNFGYKFSEYSPAGFKEPAAAGEENGFSKMPNYNTGSRSSHVGVKVLLLFIILVLLGGIGYFIYSMMDKNEEALTENLITDTASSVVADTTGALPGAAVSTDPKFIIETTGSLSRVTNRTAQLARYGHKVLVDTVDTNGQKNYRLYFQVDLQNPADTARIKDSLTRYFGRKVIVEQ